MAALGGGDDPGRDAVPRVALAGDGDEPVARVGAQVVRRLQPRDDAVREVGDRAVPTGNDSQGRAGTGTAAASGAVTSARPECAAEIGRMPHAAASAATMPKASGNVLGTTWASQAASSGASSSCSSRPVSTTRSPSAAAAVR